jgi:uncharacterized protein with HEPN domain
MSDAADNPSPSSSGGTAARQPSGDLYVASLLASFFEAGWAIQVLVGDADQAQFEASRLARPEAEKHLRAMSDIARALPEPVRVQMPKVDWQSWMDLGDYLPPRDAHARALIWTAIDAWLPPAGLELRRYRRQLPQLWRFKL